MRIKLFFLGGWMLLFFKPLFAQSPYHYGPGFDAQECDDLLRLNFSVLDTNRTNQFIGFQKGYRFLYRSPDIGLDNAWDLWMREDSTPVILLRGTTADPKSILADFYCAMMPATGVIVLPEKDSIPYHLASDERAAVHAGFLIGFAYLSKDIAPKVDSLYRKGYLHFLVAGHSQGGALTYYISAWLLYLKKKGVYPGLRVKTYASASPKMGNMYFAYDYDNLTRSRWTFSIVNSADAVPEMPFTTQQVDMDMNNPNPILNLQKHFMKLPLLKRTVLNHAFYKMMRSAAKSSKAYQKYLGGYSSAFLKKMLPGIVLPDPVNTTYFVRPGVPIILMANTNYFDYFKVNDGPYYHHGIIPYRYLLRQYYEGVTPMTKEEEMMLRNMKP